MKTRKILCSVAGILSALLGFYMLVMAMMLLACYIAVVLCVDVADVVTVALILVVISAALSVATTFWYFHNQDR